MDSQKDERTNLGFSVFRKDYGVLSLSSVPVFRLALPGRVRTLRPESKSRRVVGAGGLGRMTVEGRFPVVCPSEVGAPVCRPSCLMLGVGFGGLLGSVERFQGASSCDKASCLLTLRGSGTPKHLTVGQTFGPFRRPWETRP